MAGQITRLWKGVCKDRDVGCCMEEDVAWQHGMGCGSVTDEC